MVKKVLDFEPQLHYNGLNKGRNTLNKTFTLLAAASLAFAATACAEKADETVTTETVATELNDDGTVAADKTVETTTVAEQ